MNPTPYLSLTDVASLLFCLQANRASDLADPLTGTGGPAVLSDAFDDDVTVVTLEEIGGPGFDENVDQAFDRLERSQG